MNLSIRKLFTLRLLPFSISKLHFDFTLILFLAGQIYGNKDFRVLPSLLDVHLYSTREILGCPKYSNPQTWVCISPCKSIVIKFSFLTYRNRPNAISAVKPHTLNLTIYLHNIPVGSGGANTPDVLTGKWSTENLNALVRSHKDHGGNKKP